MTKYHAPRKYNFCGFTLIELLFVIAIISVLISLGASIVKQRAQEAKVEKAALQIQQILQAGMAYYVDHGKWPTTHDDDTDFSSKYIPVSGKTDPWGNLYTWCPAVNLSARGTTCDQDPTHHPALFQVAIKGKLSDVLVNRIIGMLPNAGRNEQYAVYAQTTIPAQVSLADARVYIVKAGAITVSKQSSLSKSKFDPILKIDSFTCPKGYVSTIHALVAAYKIKNDNLDSHSPVGVSSESPYLLTGTSVNATGGCNSGDAKCTPYYLATFIKARHCSVELHNAKLSPIPDRTTFNCDPRDEVVLTFKNDQIESYKIDYSIYCCKVDNPQGSISGYCYDYSTNV